MFVFVYPKDTELTDNNYMDYLAFWTGASADAGTFHERTAAHYTQRTSAKGLSILTDGWHMTTGPAIMQGHYRKYRCRMIIT